MKRAVAAALLFAACGDNSPAKPYEFCDGWHQWGNNPRHTGASCSEGQALGGILADRVIDPFAAQEEADTAGGDLSIHYQAPLVDGDDVYMMSKGGVYTPCLHPMNASVDCSDVNRLLSQTWEEVAYRWQDDQLVREWTFESDWTPEPVLSFEPMFQPAIVGDRLAVPGAAGSVWEVSRATGQPLRRDTPFGAPDIYVAGAITEYDGHLYYNALELDHDAPFAAFAHAWLVDVAPDGKITVADYQDLVPGAPAANDGCYGFLATSLETFPGFPPPQGPVPTMPALFSCGRQVPGINSAPTFAPDGTMYVVTHAQYNESYSYLVSVEATLLRTNWVHSLRDLLEDGCGVSVECLAGTQFGVDPFTGLAPAAEVDDSSSSMPVVLDDGSVIYGALTSYNGDRGHLLAFERDGGYRGNYDFGWDTTPAVAGNRILLKDNNYFDGLTRQQGPYNLTSLDTSLKPIWQYASTETRSCVENPDGTLTCMNDHPRGFEWCINAPAVDRDGTVYANSEDGHLYAVDSTGQLRDRFFLGKALGAAYTPVVLDHLGRVYALNDGHMFVIGAK